MEKFLNELISQSFKWRRNCKGDLLFTENSVNWERESHRVLEVYLAGQSGGDGECRTHTEDRGRG